MRELLVHNWRLKIVSLGAALILWRLSAPSPSSETGVTVPLEFRNIPANAEVFGDTVNSVEVRLRGPSSLLRTISAQDVSLVLDLHGTELGQQRVLSLLPDLVRAPLGIEAVRVVPAHVRFSVESTVSKLVRVVPAVEGTPAAGYEVAELLATPSNVEIQGPASHVTAIEEIPTIPIVVTDRHESFSQAVDLDIPDPVVRIPNLGSVKINIRLRPSTK